jgi:hypothetical protein
VTSTPEGPDRPGDPAAGDPPRPPLARMEVRENLWARGRTYATATWTLPLFMVVVPGVVVPLVAGGAGPVSLGARVAVVVLLLVASAFVVRRRDHGVVRGLAVGMLVATAVLAVAIPAGMLVRAVLT